MKDKIIKFPITYSQRRKNEMGKGYVPCVVSDRWLQFPEKSAGKFSKGEYMEVFVMTHGSDEKPRKICNLIITREDILRAIESVKPGD